ncbi:MAG: HEAT repeat domain-containing protein [Thermodesulfobacteriota bacterium]
MNKKKSLLIILVILSLITFGDCFAQIYSWIDENGVKHFSDTPVIIGNKIDVLIQDENKPVSKTGWKMYISTCENDQDFDMLIKALKHDKFFVRQCAIQGLALYGDSRACEILTDVFISDPDTGVRHMAMEAIEHLNCKVSTKDRIDNKHCDFGQSLVNMMSPIISKAKNYKDFQSSSELKEIGSEIMKKYDKLSSFSDNEQKDVEMNFAIFSQVVDWAQSATKLRLSLQNEIASQRHRNVTSLMRVKDKKARLHQLCPNLVIPDYGESSY